MKGIRGLGVAVLVVGLVTSGSAVAQSGVDNVRPVMPGPTRQVAPQPTPLNTALKKKDTLFLGGFSLDYSRNSGDRGSSTVFEVLISGVLEHLLTRSFAMGVGASVGYDYVSTGGGSMGAGMFELGPRIAAYIPAGATVAPYFALQLGVSHNMIKDAPDGTGLHVKPELGLAVKLRQGLLMKVGLGYTFRYMSFDGDDVYQHSVPVSLAFGGIF